jgi:hypothetical protein
LAEAWRANIQHGPTAAYSEVFLAQLARQPVWSGRQEANTNFCDQPVFCEKPKNIKEFSVDTQNDGA